MDNESYIKECILLARKSEKKDEIPVGAILVKNNTVLSRAHNMSISLNDPTAHAEINAIREACIKVNNYRIANSTLYTTLEPCPMCISAICEARIDRVIFGAYADKEKNFISKFEFMKKKFTLNHTPEFIGGVLEKECSLVIKKFFKAKRC